MRCFRRALLLLAVFALIGCDDDAEPGVVRTYPAPPIAAPQKEAPGPDVSMFVFAPTWGGSDPRHIIFSASADGRVAWSDNKLRGGDTLRYGTLSLKRLTELREQLAVSARRFGKDEWISSGPDAAFTVIRFRLADGRMAEFGSWHELAEAGGAVIATERGLEPRGQATARNIQTEEAVTYARFRTAWDQMRQAIQTAIRDAESAGPPDPNAQ